MAASSRIPGAILKTTMAAGVSPPLSIAYLSVTLMDETQRATTKTGAGIDLGAPGVLSLLLTVGTVTGTMPTLDAALQDSPDGTTWTAVSTGAYTQVTASTASQRVKHVVDRWVRLVGTIAGTTPKFDFTAVGEFKVL